MRHARVTRGGGSSQDYGTTYPTSSSMSDISDGGVNNNAGGKAAPAPLKMPAAAQQGPQAQLHVQSGGLPVAPGTPGTPGAHPGPSPVPQTPTGAPPAGAAQMPPPASAFETDLPQQLLTQGKFNSILTF